MMSPLVVAGLPVTVVTDALSVPGVNRVTSISITDTATNQVTMLSRGAVPDASHYSESVAVGSPSHAQVTFLAPAAPASATISWGAVPLMDPAGSCTVNLTPGPATGLPPNIVQIAPEAPSAAQGPLQLSALSLGPLLTADQRIAVQGTGFSTGQAGGNAYPNLFRAAELTFMGGDDVPLPGMVPPDLGTDPASVLGLGTLHRFTPSIYALSFDAGYQRNMLVRHLSFTVTNGDGQTSAASPQAVFLPPPVALGSATDLGNNHYAIAGNFFGPAARGEVRFYGPGFTSASALTGAISQFLRMDLPGLLQSLTPAPTPAQADPLATFRMAGTLATIDPDGWHDNRVAFTLPGTQPAAGFFVIWRDDLPSAPVLLPLRLDANALLQDLVGSLTISAPAASLPAFAEVPCAPVEAAIQSGSEVLASQADVLRVVNRVLAPLNPVLAATGVRLSATWSLNTAADGTGAEVPGAATLRPGFDGLPAVPFSALGMVFRHLPTAVSLPSLTPPLPGDPRPLGALPQAAAYLRCAVSLSVDGVGTLTASLPPIPVPVVALGLPRVCALYRFRNFVDTDPVVNQDSAVLVLVPDGPPPRDAQGQDLGPLNPIRDSTGQLNPLGELVLRQIGLPDLNVFSTLGLLGAHLARLHGSLAAPPGPGIGGLSGMVPVGMNAVAALSNLVGLAQAVATFAASTALLIEKGLGRGSLGVEDHKPWAYARYDNLAAATSLGGQRAGVTYDFIQKTIGSIAVEDETEALILLGAPGTAITFTVLPENNADHGDGRFSTDSGYCCVASDLGTFGPSPGTVPVPLPFGGLTAGSVTISHTVQNDRGASRPPADERRNADGSALSSAQRDQVNNSLARVFSAFRWNS